jgi:hypothetical protein
MKNTAYLMLILLLSSCAIGYKKLTDKKLERQKNVAG